MKPADWLMSNDWQQSDGTFSTSNSLSALLETVFLYLCRPKEGGVAFFPNHLNRGVAFPRYLAMLMPHPQFGTRGMSSLSTTEVAVVYGLPARPSEKDVLVDCALVPKKGGMVS